MKALVTGGTGYVGGIICTALTAAGFDVTSLGRSPRGKEGFFYRLEDEAVSLPLGRWDVVVHAAYDFSARGDEAISARNVVPSLRLLEAASGAGVERFVFISSISAYEGCRSDYGRAKLEIEDAVLQRGGLVIRPGLVWGDQPGGVMGNLVRMVRTIPVVPWLCGHPSPSQYLVHEQDLGASVAAFCDADWKPSLLHSATNPQPIAFRELLRTIAKRAGLRRLFVPVPWRFVLWILCALEAFRIPLSFRSDSLIGLVFRNPTLQGLECPRQLSYRPFTHQ